MVASLLGGCGISKEVYQGDVNRLRKQIDTLEGSNSTLDQRYAACTRQVAELEGIRDSCLRELEAMKSQGGQLSAELRDALRRIRELEAVAARQKAVFDQLTKALQSLVNSGKLSIAIVRGQFTVQMAEKILFDSGKFALKPEAEGTLTQLTNVLLSVPDRRWQVSGHTDTDGSPEFNWRLSGNRSRVVVEFMIEQGMEPERLTFAGAGMYRPVASNETPEEKAQNRRVEFVLVPNLEELLAPLRKQ